MSMTREEAIERLEWLKETCHGLATRTPSWQRWALQEAALNMALTALRFPTREMVERMFPGCALCNWGGLDYVGVDGDGIYLSKPPKNEKFRFCPVCGKPLTDEAVDMMLERWKEAVDGEAD